MRKGQKRARKALLVFLVFMLILTFFSRTIYYYFLPKVAFQRAAGGTLETYVYSNDVILYSDEAVRVDISENLMTTQLYIMDLYAERNSRVNMGDALLQFDIKHAENMLGVCAQRFKRAQEALDAWDNEFASMMGNESKIINSVSRLSLEEKYLSAKSRLDVLTKLGEDNWVIRAPVSGIVSEVFVQSREFYVGLLPIVQIIPDEAAFRLGIVCHENINISSPESVSVHDDGLLASDSELPWTYYGETEEKGTRYLWASYNSTQPLTGSLSGVYFSIKSDYYQALVPNSAIVGNSVFVLDNREGVWGAKELYVREVNISSLPSDGNYTGVSFGISITDNIIMSTDRPLSDGDVVVVPL